jgi:hypothetical protein
VGLCFFFGGMKNKENFHGMSVNSSGDRLTKVDKYIFVVPIAVDFFDTAADCVSFGSENNRCLSIWGFADK